MARLCRIGALVAAALLLTSSAATGATDYDVTPDGVATILTFCNGPFVVLGK